MSIQEGALTAIRGVDDPGLVAVPPAPPRRGSRIPTPVYLAVVLGLVAAVMVLRLTKTTSVQVAVAARPLAAGELVRESDLRFVDVGASSALAATLLTPKEVVGLSGRQALRAIPAGSLVTKADLVAGDAGPQLRTMSIPIETTHATGGSLTRGDTVDVIDSSGSASVFVVTGARVTEVASIGSTKIGSASTKYSVTVAVDDAAALRLAAAITAGKIDVVRSTGSSPALAQSPPTTVRR